MIPSNDPGAACRALRGRLDEAIKRVLDSGFYILGPELDCFEKEFAAFLGKGEAVGVASGTDAIELALRSLGIGPGDAVLTVSHTAVATVAAIEHSGAIPVLADIDPRTFTLCPASARRCLDHYSDLPFKAILPVHLYGQTADMDGILELSRTFRLEVIEDCSQAHGASYKGKMAGTFGILSAFSFYPTKNLGALGDAGAVCSSSETLIRKLRLLRQYGWNRRHYSEIKGINSRLDELQAAILRVRLEHLSSGNLRRNDIARRYDGALSGAVATPYRSPECTAHAYHQYTIRTNRRDGLRAFLEEEGIQTAVLYPHPVHRQPAYQALPSDPEGLPETEKAAGEILCLPIHPELPDSAVEDVCKAVVSFSLRNRRASSS